MTARRRAVAAAATALALLVQSLSGVAPAVARTSVPLAPATAVRAAASSPPAPVARPSETPAHGAPRTTRRTDCSATLALGAPERCDFGSAGVATYTFDVAGADRLRLRATDADGTAQPALTLRATDASVVCTRPTGAQSECVVSSAGTYSLEVAASGPGTVWTTVDSVRTPGDCTAQVDVAANAAPWQVLLDRPGLSRCGHVPSTAVAELFGFALAANGDGVLDVRIYSATGVPLCTVSASRYQRVSCSVDPAADPRIFVTSPDDYASPVAVPLFVTRLSHPSGCPAGPVDAYGARPTRSGDVDAFALRCYATTTAAADVLVVRLTVRDTVHTLAWELRAPDGTRLCGDISSAAPVRCVIPSDGTYALFVVGGLERIPYALSLTAPLRSAGCVALPSTAFGAPAAVGTLVAGQVDCRSFSGSAGHPTRIPVWGATGMRGTLLAPDGSQVCVITGRTSCVLPADGTYRLLIAGPAGEYRTWATDLASDAGCTATSPDAFGTITAREGTLDENTSTRCWSFTAARDSSELVRLSTLGGNMFLHGYLVSSDGTLQCEVLSTPAVCRSARSGTYRFFGEPYGNSFQPGGSAQLRLGLWRTDGAGCSAARLSYAVGPQPGSLARPDEADCRSLTTTDRDAIIVHTGVPGGGSTPNVTQLIVSADGRTSCFAGTTTPCVLQRPGRYLVVAFSFAHDTGAYATSIRSVTHPTACRSLAARSYGTGPGRAFDLAPGEVACALLTHPTSYAAIVARLQTSSGAPVYGRVYDLRGKVRCAVNQRAYCKAKSADPLVYVVFGYADATGTFGWYENFTSDGCAAQPSGSFAEPPLPGAIRAAGEVDCIELGTSAVDRKVRLGVASAPDGMVVHLEVIGRRDRVVCSWATSDYFRTKDCSLPRNYRHRLLVWAEDGPAPTGRYALHLWQLSDPPGCTRLGSAAGGVGPVEDALADPDDQDCYQFTGDIGLQLHFTVTNPESPASIPVVDLLNQNGNLVCEVYSGSGTCTLTSAGRWTMLVFGASQRPDFTGRYVVEATTTAKRAGCDETVELGATSECSLATGDTARYTVAVPADDTLRYRAVVPSGVPSRTLTLVDDQGTAVCSDTGASVVDCPVTAGTYTLEVTVAQANPTPVFTSIDGVLDASCGPPVDLAVGGSGASFDIAAPGASDCAALDAAGGDVLSLTLDSNGDQAVDVRVYDAHGVLRCRAPQVTPYGRTTCIPSGGNGLRMFVSATDEFTQSVDLVAMRLNDPTGCSTGALDPFGVAATRTAGLAPHQAVCFDLGDATAAGVSVLASGTSIASLKWGVYGAAGQAACSGVAADLVHALTACVLDGASDHTLIVSTQSRFPTGLVVSLVDPASGAGCVTLPSTAWDAQSVIGNLDLGEVDCREFTGTANTFVRPVVSAENYQADGLLLAADGTQVCTFLASGECRLPADGTYRAIVSTPARDELRYELWAIDATSTAGCLPITPDTFGTAPAHTAEFTLRNLAVCYTFTAPTGAAYVVEAASLTSQLALVQGALRSEGAAGLCSQRVCSVATGGSQLLIISRNVVMTTRVGEVLAGLYRLDRLDPSASCPAVPTTFTAPAAAASISRYAEIDCHRFAAAADDVVAFNSTRQPFFETVRHEIYDATGDLLCVTSVGTCPLSGPGPYRVISYASAFPTTARYRFTVASLSAADAGCRPLAELAFGVAPRAAFDLDDRAGMRCFRVERTSSNGYLAARLVTETPRPLDVQILGPNLAFACSPDQLGACFARDAGTYTFVLRSDRPASGLNGWYDLQHTAGCTAGPDLSFGPLATQVRIRQPGAIACSSVPAAAGDLLDLAFGRTPDRSFAHMRLVVGNGFPRCGSVDDTDIGAVGCQISKRDSGPFRLLTWAGASTATGTFGIHAWRLNNPTGCTDLGSLDDGFGPLVGTLSDPGELDCYRGTFDGGQLEVHVRNTDDPDSIPRALFTRPNGSGICAITDTSTCLLPRATLSIIIGRNYSAPQFTGHYRVTGTVP